MRDALDGVAALRIPVPAQNIRHACYRFYVFVIPEKLAPGRSRAGLVDALRGVGVPCDSGVCPEIYREPCYRGALVQGDLSLPQAGALGKTAIAFPVHPGIGADRIAQMGALIREALVKGLLSHVAERSYRWPESISTRVAPVYPRRDIPA